MSKVTKRTERMIAIIYGATFTTIIMMFGVVYNTKLQLETYVVGFAFGLCYYPLIQLVAEWFKKKRN